MMVAIDETGHDDMSAVTQDLIRLVAAGEILVGANLDDLAIALEDRAVLDDRCPVVIDDPADDVLTSESVKMTFYAALRTRPMWLYLFRFHPLKN